MYLFTSHAFGNGQLNIRFKKSKNGERRLLLRMCGLGRTISAQLKDLPIKCDQFAIQFIKRTETKVPMF
ncbi:Uncharacterised protein [Vibrio cholerae]|nr:Uncharacterised protein [Vibrio cholerae]CSC25910.1 Uncharacterised protein [Vibrio cholerae]